MPILLLPPTGGSGGSLPAWPYRRLLTLDEEFIDGTLTDFPVLVKLTSENYDWTHSRSDGFDIRFFDSDGTTALDFERERHDNANKLAEYWVRVASVSSSADTQIYIQYGNLSATDGAAAVGTVWDANYVGVYHMDEDPTSTSGGGITDTLSGPSPVTAIGSTVTTSSFTPTANSLIIAFANVGNTAGAGTHTCTVSDSLGSSWTLLKRSNNDPSGAGSAEVWAMDAGASPAARTVTVLGAGSANATGVSLCVRTFSGTKPVATVLGASANPTGGTAYTIALTTTVTGSLVVGSLSRITTNVTLTPNASTTGIQAVSDATNTETYGAWRATAVTGTPGAGTYGYSNVASARQVLAAVELLAATASPSTLTDSSGTGNHGTGTGGMAIGNRVESPMGRAWNFDGTDDYVALPNFGNLAAVTVEIWFKPDAFVNANAGLVSQNDFIAGTTHFDLQTTGDMKVGVAFQSGVQTPVSTTAWWYGAYTFAVSGNVVLYKNGESAVTSTAGATNWLGTGIEIAHEYNAYTAGARFLDGLVDEVRISNTVRAPEWLKANHHSGRLRLLNIGDENPAPSTGVSAVGSLNAGVAGFSAGKKVGVNATRLAAAVVAMGSEKKVVAETGVLNAAVVYRGVGGKVVTRVSNLPATVAVFNIGKKVITRASALPAAVTTPASGKKVAVESSSLSAGVIGLSSGTKIAVEAGRLFSAIVPLVTAKKVKTATGNLPAAVVILNTGKKSAVCASALPMAATGLGSGKKISNQAGRLNATVVSLCLGIRISRAVGNSAALIWAVGTGSSAAFIFGAGRLCPVVSSFGTGSKKVATSGIQVAAVTGLPVGAKVVTRAGVTPIAVGPQAAGKKVMTRAGLLQSAITSTIAGQKAAVCASRVPVSATAFATGNKVGNNTTRLNAALGAFSSGKKVGNNATRLVNTTVLLGSAKHVGVGITFAQAAITALSSGKKVGKGASAGAAIVAAMGLGKKIGTATSRQVVVIWTFGEGTSDIVVFGGSRLGIVVTARGTGTKRVATSAALPAAIVTRLPQPKKVVTSTGAAFPLVTTSGANLTSRSANTRLTILNTEFGVGKKRGSGTSLVAIVITPRGVITIVGAAPNTLDAIATPRHFFEGFVTPQHLDGIGLFSSAQSVPFGQTFQGVPSGEHIAAIGTRP